MMPDILAAGSTYAVSLLTVGYVLTTSRQLDVMADQLEEAKRYRELQYQPLPWINRIDLYVEKPRLFFSPTKNHAEFDYEFISRYIARSAIKNLGTSPAICIDILAKIIIPQENKTSVDLNSVSKRIDVLESGEIYPSDIVGSLEHMFSGDEEGKFLNSIRETSPAKIPHFGLKILYKNIMGGCFIISNEFFVHPKNLEQDRVIAKWLGLMASFPVEYKDEIASLKKFDALKSEKSDALFDELKGKLDKIITDANIELILIPLGTCKVKVISEEEYAKFVERLNYSMPLSPKAIYSMPCQETSS
jgi:hypothetical protein